MKGGDRTSRHLSKTRRVSSGVNPRYTVNIQRGGRFEERGRFAISPGACGQTPATTEFSDTRPDFSDRGAF